MEYEIRYTCYCPAYPTVLSVFIEMKGALEKMGNI